MGDDSLEIVSLIDVEEDNLMVKSLYKAAKLAEDKYPGVDTDISLYECRLLVTCLLNLDYGIWPIGENDT